MRVGFQNAFLIRPVRLGGRRGLTIFDPGAHRERVSEYAGMLPDRYDVWATTELFAPADLATLARAWDEVTPPGAVIAGPSAQPRRAKATSSGLAMFVSGWSVVRVRRHVFAHDGRRRTDADTWAAKGVLMVGLAHRLGARLDLAVTHLHAGGYLGDEPTSASGVRRRQVHEAATFLESNRRRGVSLMVGGDWNIDGGAAGETGGADDTHLREAMRRMDLVDAWDVGGDGEGYTSDCASRVDFFELDPADDRYCLDPAPPCPDLARIDRCFVSRDGGVTVRSIRRRLHRRKPSAEGFDVISTLSDHLGLDVDLDVAVAPGQ